MINKWTERVFCLGNGESRNELTTPKNWIMLRLQGITYGCNAFYRDFRPDILIARDRGMMHEIYRSGYCKRNICYFEDWNPLPLYSYELLAKGVKNIDESDKGDSSTFVMHGAEKDGLIREGEGGLKYWITWVDELDEVNNIPFAYMDAGPTTVKLACELENPKEVFLLGHDLQSPKHINNIYKDTSNYFPSDYPRIFAENWVNDLGQIFKQYPNVTFYRVVIPKEKMELLSEEVSEVAAWSDIDNIMHIDVNDLWKMLDK